MLTLYYFPTSHWSRIITLSLAEAGLDFEPRFVDITTGENFAPDYLRLNPRGVVPTLVDRGQAIWDGRRIARHIDDLSGAGLWPAADDGLTSLIEELHDFPLMLLSYSVWVLGKRGERSATILDDKIARARQLAQEHPEFSQDYERKAKFFEGFRDQVYDGEHVAQQKRRCGEQLKSWATRVEQAEFLAGDSYSLADAIATSILYRLKDLGQLAEWATEDSSALFRYYQRLSQRPSFHQVFLDDPWIDPKHRPAK